MLVNIECRNVPIISLQGRNSVAAGTLFPEAQSFLVMFDILKDVCKDIEFKNRLNILAAFAALSSILFGFVVLSKSCRRRYEWETAAEDLRAEEEALEDGKGENQTTVIPVGVAAWHEVFAIVLRNQGDQRAGSR